MRILLVVLGIVLFASSANAEQLTRSKCWTWLVEGYSGNRIVCFLPSGRAKMTNRSETIDGKGWSTCEWTGRYKQDGTDLTVSFEAGSGKCSNGAVSPQYSLVCDFPGDRLECKSSSMVGGKHLQFERTFN